MKCCSQSTLKYDWSLPLYKWKPGHCYQNLGPLPTMCWTADRCSNSNYWERGLADNWLSISVLVHFATSFFTLKTNHRADYPPFFEAELFRNNLTSCVKQKCSGFVMLALLILIDKVRVCLWFCIYEIYLKPHGITPSLGKFGLPPLLLVSSSLGGSVRALGVTLGCGRCSQVAWGWVCHVPSR